LVDREKNVGEMSVTDRQQISPTFLCRATIFVGVTTQKKTNRQRRITAYLLASVNRRLCDADDLFVCLFFCVDMWLGRAHFTVFMEKKVDVVLQQFATS